DLEIDDVIVDMIIHDGDDPPAGIGLHTPCGPKTVIIDPNVMVVYEEDETEGDFDLSLVNQPRVGATITVTVDPNTADDGPSEDIILIGGGPNIALTFTETTGGDPCDPCSWTPENCTDWDESNRISCWNVPQTVIFKAIDDNIAEPPELLEPQLVSISSTHETDANWVAEGALLVSVEDNDQANILFASSKAESSSPKTPVRTGDSVQIWEEPRVDPWGVYDRWRKIWVRLQVPPLIDADPCQPTEIKLNLEVTDISNMPETLPTILPYPTLSEPNGLTFTADNYTTYQSIKIWGNDDDVLQAGGDTDGDQNYQATLNVWVIDGGGDVRYEWYEEDPEDPGGPEILVGLKRTVTIDIQDNECGAFGILPLDISNRYYLTDPNYAQDDPDCYVDIYDITEMARQWLDCSTPGGAGCERP
ncbi:unnamed protein product, partial [marine sediment metagenome]